MEAPVREGDVLAGKYRVERVLGAGGMGVVVAAQHVQLGQHVALKFLRPEACRDATAVERFLREARAAVRIHSEHVARVSDVGTLETGSPYMVMEYLEGRDLSDVVQAQGPMPVALATDYILQACEAVAEAHSLGIVHRDLKPANLFLTRRPDGSALIKVLDFGISKARQLDGGTSQAAMTATATVMGSPMYMSPEQVRSAKSVDARSDIWALGVVLHELITGRAVYDADTMPGLLAMIVADPPAPLRAHRPDAPADLEAVILRCLNKDPKGRPQNVGELAKALLPFAPSRAKISVERIYGVLQLQGSSEPWLSVPPPADRVATGAAAAGVPTQTVEAWGNTRSGQTSSRPAWVVALAVGVVAVAGAGVFFGWGMLHRDSAHADTATATATPTPTTTATTTTTPTASAAPAEPPRESATAEPAERAPVPSASTPKHAAVPAPIARTPARVAPSPVAAPPRNTPPAAPSPKPASNAKKPNYEDM